MWKRKKRQKPQGTTDSNPSDARNRGLNRGSSDGGLEGDTWEEMEPNRYASRIVRDKGLQEIVSAFKPVQYWAASDHFSVDRTSGRRRPSTILDFHNEPLRHLQIFVGGGSKSLPRCEGVCGETHGIR